MAVKIVGWTTDLSPSTAAKALCIFPELRYWWRLSRGAKGGTENGRDNGAAAIGVWRNILRSFRDEIHQDKNSVFRGSIKVKKIKIKGKRQAHLEA